MNNQINKKYELTDETREYCGHTLYRIRALRDFAEVKKGEDGGWIESEENLSHEGNCWVYEDAMVYEEAEVIGNVEIWGKTKLRGKVRVWGEVQIFGTTEINGDAEIWQ